MAGENANEIPPIQPGTHIGPTKTPERVAPEQLRAISAIQSGNCGHLESNRRQATHPANAASDDATSATDANPTAAAASSAAATASHTGIAQSKQNNRITPVNIEAAGPGYDNPNLESDPNKRKYKAKLAECLRHAKT